MIEAVRELAHRLEVPYILDPGVSEEALSRTVRLRAAHLDGRQALRWTVRVADLDSVLVEGVVMIAPADRLPLSWRLGSAVVTTGAAPDPGGPALPVDARWQAANAARADLGWLDAPLSRVANDISDKFEIDVVFHPRILDDQVLIRFEGQDLSLTQVTRALDEQLSAVCEYDDGVVWVRPKAPASTQPAPPPSGTSAPALAFQDQGSVLFRPIDLRLADTDAAGASESMGRAAGITCRIEPPGAIQPVRMLARGSLLEILEAARILDGWDWSISPAAESAGAILLIRTGGSGRSVP